MKSSPAAFITVILLMIAVETAIPQQPARVSSPVTSILNRLKPGQAVSLKDAGGSYEIHVCHPDGFQFPLDYTVADVNGDYVVIRNKSEDTETAIPVTSIKALIAYRFQSPKAPSAPPRAETESPKKAPSAPPRAEADDSD